MKKVFKFIGYALLSIIGLIAILLTGVKYHTNVLRYLRQR